jgi:uncharacterized membrane protein
MQQQLQKSTVATAQWVVLSMPLLAAAHMAFYYPLLPAKLASHFGPDGRADGWMAKLDFVIFHLVMTTLLALLFGGMGALMHKIPNDAINLPNKEYWLAPERREQTLRQFSKEMSVFGIACLAFLFAVIQTVILSNLAGKNQLGPLFFVYFIGFLLFTAHWAVQLTKRYKLP